MNMEEDILIELNKNDLNAMLQILEHSLPTNIRAYNYIKSYLIHYDYINENRDQLQSGRWNVKFYAPHNNKNGSSWLKNCTFVTITGIKDYYISVFTLEIDCLELKKALKETNRIQWQNDALEFFTETHLFELVEDIVRSKRASDDWSPVVREFVMYMSKRDIQNIPNESTSKEHEMVLLKPEHAQLINDYWQYKGDNSYHLIKEAIDLNGGLGILQIDSKNLVAWILTNDFFALGFLYTIEMERRKGLGSWIFKAEMKRIVEKFGIDVCTNVVCNNVTSIEMHKKLGFKSVNNISFLTKEKN